MANQPAKNYTLYFSQPPAGTTVPANTRQFFLLVFGLGLVLLLMASGSGANAEDNRQAGGSSTELTISQENDSASNQANSLAHPLEGGVADTWIPPNRLLLNEWKNKVSPRLQSGLKWSDSLLPQQYTEDFWMPIPAWLAGTWHTETASFIGSSGKRIGETSAYLSRHDDTFGHQRDKSGATWHLVRYPFISITQGNGTTSYFVDFTFAGNAKNPFHVTLDADDMEVIVGKADQKIQQVKRRHDATSWIKIGVAISVDDLMTSDDSAHNGTIRAQPKQIAPYKRIDKLPDGYDVKDSFHRFLVNGGKSDLLPDGSANKP